MYSITASGGNITVKNVKNPNPANQFNVATVASTSRDLTWIYSEDGESVTLIVDGVRCEPVKFGQVSVAGSACTSKSDFETKIAALSSTAGSVSSAGIQPKIYRALLTQANTGNPSAIVLENTTGVTISWTRDDVGVYLSNTNSTNFPVEKTFVSIVSGVAVNVVAAYNNSGVFVVSTASVSSGLSDNILGYTSIQILVYP